VLERLLVDQLDGVRRVHDGDRAPADLDVLRHVHRDSLAEVRHEVPVAA
jgi:hypothetical protein